MTTTNNNVTIQVPQELLGDLQAYLAQLQVMSAPAPAPALAPVELESMVAQVRQVINHRINADGVWSFNIMFTDKSTEWVVDDKCDCELKIGEYMASRKLRTAHLFCRVSTKDQASSTSTSLATQETELRSAVVGGEQRIRVHKLSESAYKRMPHKLSDLGTTAVGGDSIYVWRVDRLSRNICTTLSWVEDLDARGVHLVAHSEGLTYRDNKLAFIQSILDAQKEAALLGQRVKMSYKHKRDRGDEAVGGLPWGKKYHRIMSNNGLNTKCKVVVDNPAELILKTRIKCSNECPTLLAHTLNMEGLTKRGRKWSVSMIKTIRKGKKM